jgi:hypothetical protein
VEDDHDGSVLDDETHFAVVARSPSGVAYDVQAVPGFGVRGPLQVGTKNGLFEHGPLGLLNRVLAKRCSSTEWNNFAAFVYSHDPDRSVVAESMHGSMRGAREAARAFVQAITDGTFEGD